MWIHNILQDKSAKCVLATVVWLSIPDAVTPALFTTTSRQPERVDRYLHSGFDRILIYHVEGSGPNLISTLLQQVFQAAGIASG
jgi:hypothetical protein